jgi:benzoylformate decarboxylase
MERLRGEKEAERGEREKIVREHRDDVPIHLTRLVRELNQAVDKDAIIVDEAARSSRTLLKFYDFEVPGTFHRSVGGYLGWGGPAALGVKLANPGRQVISLVGDGSFLFSIQNLWTAARYHIPVVFVICNNREYRAVKETCVQYKGAGAKKGVFPATDIKDPDIEFCRLAEGFGVWARKIVHPEEIGLALKEALNLGKAAVLDVRIG